MAVDAVDLEGGSDVQPLEALPATFSDLALPAWMCQALEEGLGFREPTPVQQRALPLARTAKHLVVQAKSGTGKTVAFSCAAVEKACAISSAWAVVVAPTRELALQHERTVSRVAEWAPDKSLAVYGVVGGTARSFQENDKILEALRSRSQSGVLVATPGRLHAIVSLAHSPREAMRSVKCVVLDEADRLLEGNYDDHLGLVLSSVPERSQVLAFSATYTPALLRRLEAITGRSSFVVPHKEAELVLDSPLAGGGGSRDDVVTLRRVRQYVTEVPMGRGGLTGGTAGQSRRGAFLGKVDRVINSVLSSFPFDQAILFCNNKAHARLLVSRLEAEGFASACISGDMLQGKRNAVMAAVRDSKVRILVATDLISRGLDLEKVNLVVNLDLPKEGRTLLHRVGRTGRHGVEGVAVHVVSGGEVGALRQLFESAGAHDAKLLPLKVGNVVSLTEEGKQNVGADLQEREGRHSLLDAKETGADVHEIKISPQEDSRSRNRGAGLDLSKLPEHVQRWMWWQWRYQWWCKLKCEAEGLDTREAS